MLNEIITIMNQPIIIIIVISIPSVIIFKHFFKAKLEIFRAKNKDEKNKQYKLESISGKIAFAVANTDLAYQKVMKDINNAKRDMGNANDPNTKKIFENKIKSSEQQLKVIQKIMEHKDVVDMISPLAIPAMEKIEKKLMSFVKSGFNI